MRLTQWTDYSLRVLMYCAHAEGRDKPVTITEIAQSHRISRNHPTKVVMTLADVVGQGAHRIGIPLPVRVMRRTAPRKG